MSDDYTLTWHRGKLALTFAEGGKRLRITTGTADHALAESRAAEIWERRNAAASEQVVDLWPAYVRDRVKDGVIEDRFNVTWKALGPYFGSLIGSQVTRDDCRRYNQLRREAGKAASTVTTELALLRACLRWRYGPNAPALWIPSPSKPRDHWLTKDQVNTLVEATDTPHVKLFITLAAATGARASAILDLTWDRVDFDNRRIDYMPAGREITNKRRIEVRMNDRAYRALKVAEEGSLSEHVIEYGGKPVASVKKALQRLSDKTGIRVSPHVLRHSAAVWMAQEDVPMSRIAQFLGHTKTAVTEMYYARYSPSHMQDASKATEF